MVNYYKIALPSTYELSLGEIKILRAITEFVPRVLEQSLINELQPPLNHFKNRLLNVYDYTNDSSHAVQIINR